MIAYPCISFIWHKYLWCSQFGFHFQRFSVPPLPPYITPPHFFHNPFISMFLFMSSKVIMLQRRLFRGKILNQNLFVPFLYTSFSILLFLICIYFILFLYFLYFYIFIYHFFVFLLFKNNSYS